MLFHLDPHQCPWGQGHRFCILSFFLVKPFFYFSVMKTTQADSWSDFCQPCDIDLWVMKWRSAWPIFHGPVFLPYILKTIWCMNIILWDYELVWPDVWPQNKWRSLWPIFHGPVILPYILKTGWCMNIILRDYESVWPDVWPQKNVGHCDLYFLVQWFCHVSWRLFDVWTSYFGIISEYGTTFDLKINVGLCDLYFMVQWFCFIFWRLFDICTPYFGIMSQYDPMFDLKIFVGHCNLHFMVQWFYLISWKLFIGWTSYFGIMSQYDSTSDLKIFVGQCDLYFMVHWICLISWRLFDVWIIILWDYESGWHDLWPRNKSKPLWHIFHGPVILCYIWNSIWWMNVILLENESVRPLTSK